MESIPVALFTDRSEKWHKQPETELRISCFGEDYLSFRYQLVRLKDHQAEQYRKTRNRFIAVLRSAMRYETDKKLSLAVEWIQDYGYIEKDIRLIEKNLVIMEYFLEITEPEKEIIIEMMEERRYSNMIVQELKRRGYQEGVQQGMEQGKHEAKQETARALLDEDMSIEKISQITGLSVEEIEDLRRG